MGKHPVLVALGSLKMAENRLNLPLLKIFDQKLLSDGVVALGDAVFECYCFNCEAFKDFSYLWEVIYAEDEFSFDGLQDLGHFFIILEL